MMEKEKLDLRVRRTQKMLRDALITLVIEKGFDHITVQMLSERAMINRATFYRHYADKYDLAAQVYAQMGAEYSKRLNSTEVEKPEDLFRYLFEHIAEYREFFEAMLRTMPQFQDWVRQSIEDEFRKIFLQMGNKEADLGLPLDVILRYLSTAQIGVVQWWLSAEEPVSIEEAAEYLMQLHLEGGFKPLRFDRILMK